jgi:hypothetical protein
MLFILHLYLILLKLFYFRVARIKCKALNSILYGIFKKSDELFYIIVSTSLKKLFPPAIINLFSIF